jgi:hypothetical protein
MRWAGHVARKGEKRIACRLLVEKLEGTWRLGRRRRRWMDNVEIDLGDIGWFATDWIGLAHVRSMWSAFMKTATNFRIP